MQLRIRRTGDFENEEFYCECSESFLNNKRILTFTHREEKESTKHIFKIISKDEIEWSRLGNVSSKTYFKKGEKSVLDLKMNEGSIRLSIFTKDININDDEIEIEYSIYQMQEKISDYVVNLKIRQ